MKEKNERTERKPRINVFDIVIIVLVLVVAGGAYAFTHRETKLETRLLRYSMELIDCPAGFSQNVQVGDTLTDNIKNYHMGTVISVEARPSMKLGEDRNTGNVVESAIEGKETVILVVEADVTESASDFKVDGNYVVKAGKEVAVKGNGYAGKGYILTVAR